MRHTFKEQGVTFYFLQGRISTYTTWEVNNLPAQKIYLFSPIYLFIQRFTFNVWIHRYLLYTLVHKTILFIYSIVYFQHINSWVFILYFEIKSNIFIHLLTQLFPALAIKDSFMGSFTLLIYPHCCEFISSFVFGAFCHYQMHQMNFIYFPSPRIKYFSKKL